MNFHLMAVHFPIALLTFYAVLEIISFKRLRALPYWWYLKAVLVIAGALSAFATRQTGEMIEHEFAFVKNVVEMHALWATITTAVFALLAICYLIAWISEAYPAEIARRVWLTKVWKSLTVVQQFVLRRPVSALFALFGLIAVTITGALGGAISNGPEVDPVVKFVYNLLITK
jgi:hypothetical protein